MEQQSWKFRQINLKLTYLVSPAIKNSDTNYTLMHCGCVGVQVLKYNHRAKTCACEHPQLSLAIMLNKTSVESTSMTVGICAHSTTRALIKTGTDVRINLKGVQWTNSVYGALRPYKQRSTGHSSGQII